MTEADPTNPQTAYAECKVMVERDLAPMADDNFSPTFMRNATAFGASPRMRFDIVVNNLSGLAWTTKTIAMNSDGSPWRPLVHVADIARTALAVLDAPREVIHDQAFNVGRDEDNLQVGQIADMVAAAVPGSSVVRAPRAGPDRRDYRVDFAKLRETFPHLRLDMTVACGIQELVAAYADHGLTAEEFASSRFTRLKRILELLDAGAIDDLLRLQPATTSAQGTA
jgi:nucleoside-diphosphate-sugar epimerase